MKDIPMVAVVENDVIPEHTALFGHSVIVNAGGMSPGWVLEAVRTKEGLAGLVAMLRAGVFHEIDGSGN